MTSPGDQRLDHFDHDGLEFDVDDSGPLAGDTVILLHGFPADRRCWDGVTPALNAAGYRTLAPDQRGYSPMARPQGRQSYRIPTLGADVLALADQAGVERFHIVGHDWGAPVAWYLAVKAAGRVLTLTSLSVPHAGAMNEAMRHGTQALHSWYMLAFQVPALPELVLGWRGGRPLRRALTASGLRAETAARYASKADQPGGLTGPIDWYRALPLNRRAASGRRRRVGGGGGPAKVQTPTLMIWGPGDPFITRRAAEATGAWVAGPYRFLEIPGATHWLPEESADAVADALIDHLGAHPA